MLTAFLATLQRFFYPEPPAAAAPPPPQLDQLEGIGLSTNTDAQRDSLASATGVVEGKEGGEISAVAGAHTAEFSPPAAAAPPVAAEASAGVAYQPSQPPDEIVASPSGGSPYHLRRRKREDDGNNAVAAAVGTATRTRASSRGLASPPPSAVSKRPRFDIAKDGEEGSTAADAFQKAFWDEFIEDADPDWIKVRGRDNLYPSSSQYACLEVPAVERVLDLLEIGPDGNSSKDDLFVDWGSGIGNVVWQAAFTRQCDVRGIERMPHRHQLAQDFHASVVALEAANLPEDVRRALGRVRLVQGDLRDPQHLGFLTVPDRAGQVVKALANNRQGNWESEEQGLVLDHVVAGLFATLPPGSILVTFHPLRLGLSRSKAAEHRAANGLSEIPDASYFEEEQVDLGTAGSCFSGMQSRDPVTAYKYTRVAQPGHDVAVFACGNPQCVMGRSGTYQPAAKRVPWPNHPQGGQVVTLNECDCGYAPRTLRSRRRRRGHSAPVSPP